MSTRILTRILTNVAIGRRKFYTTTNLLTLLERDRKSGYKIVYDRPPVEEDLTVLQRIVKGYGQFKEEFGILMEEVRERLTKDPIVYYRPNEVDVIWRFQGDPKSLDQWVLTCDSDYEEGFSTAKLEMSSIGTGIFSGILSNRLPKDGRIKYSGYCNITTTPKYKSFKREIYHDWSEYTHLILRIRGDGRTYGINLNNRGFYDLTWNDLYHYVLYTRGGPYWQYVKIPFSKFVFSSKGRIQDKQNPVLLFEIANLGITLADDIPGHFRLEIDYIGLECDKYNEEETAYEGYDQTGIRF
ncbi:PREDICTED: complex I intermediate-associated protein 30, mitochondrial [Dinoponera quadriceps]|uniref:Complex I intermediate-associated protein 30, mitochondrial n=1 Tax=Dinoponera quadriceps TaxID=609295 RepID=A0A6P3WXE9_DINQU|nr:PREDICTED: complex I intermediate-associated protein 30, mitochondrial [Dinoponera quadriceps]